VKGGVKVGGPPPDGVPGGFSSVKGVGGKVFWVIMSPRPAGRMSTLSLKGRSINGAGVSSAIVGTSVCSSGRTPQASSK
jgi:hypothetical protein